MTKRILLISLFLLLATAAARAQMYGATGKTYPVSTDGDRYVVNGFFTYTGQTDRDIFAKTLIWVVDNVCTSMHDGIRSIDYEGLKFSCDLVLSSVPGTGQENQYYCTATFQVGDGQLLYYISDIVTQSSVLFMKRVTPLEKLAPEKKESHKKVFDDFVASESTLLNKVSDFVSSYSLSPLTHWDNIVNRIPAKGMTMDECKLAFGKPRMESKMGTTTQWTYTSSLKLFFKGDAVATILQ